MALVLGIDLGTQHLKALVLDVETGQVTGEASAAIDLFQGDDGSAEQHADWWLSALREAMAGIDRDSRQSIAAIGVSGQQHGFVPVGSKGEVLAPVKLWCDTATVDQCRSIMDQLGGADRCIELAGNPVLTGYTAPKVRWLKEQRPADYAAMQSILLPHDYLNFYFTGVMCMEAGDASGTGFMDVRTRNWSPEVLAAIDPERDLRECLPSIQTTNQAVGEVTHSAATEFGISPGIPVSIGGGDNMMGAIGTGNVEPGRLTLSLGTSGTAYAYSDSPIVDPKGEIAAFCSSNGGWLPLLCTMNCTVSSELMRSLIESDLTEFEARIAAAKPGSDGVLTLPFFNGERTPDLPFAKGCVLGLDGQNARPENLLRSSIEGATFALRSGVEKLRDLGCPSDEIVLTGGGANSATWRQMVADVFGLPVRILGQREGAAYGAALQAASMLTGDSLSALTNEFLTTKVRLSSEPESSERYEVAYQKYQESVAVISQLYS